MEGIGGDCVKCFLALAVSTGFGMMFQHFQMSESNIIMLYLLGVLLAAMTVSRRGAVVVSSLLSVLLFNFFFVEPLYSFQMDGKEYPVTIAVMLAASLITSSLMNRVRSHSEEMAKAYRTEILLDNSRKAAKSRDKKEIRGEADRSKSFGSCPCFYHIPEADWKEPFSSQLTEGPYAGGGIFKSERTGSGDVERRTGKEGRSMYPYAAGCQGDLPSC